jgi:hypothetical protein
MGRDWRLRTATSYEPFVHPRVISVVDYGWWYWLGANSQLVYQSALAVPSTVLRSYQQRHLCCSLPAKFDCTLWHPRLLAWASLPVRDARSPRTLWSTVFQRSCVRLLWKLMFSCYADNWRCVFHDATAHTKPISQCVNFWPPTGARRIVSAVSRCGIPAAETALQFLVSDLFSLFPFLLFPSRFVLSFAFYCILSVIHLVP